MLIALISDIHSNWEALQAVWKEVKHADTILCMGDLVGYGASPNEVVEFVRKQMGKRTFLCVRGNHDNAVAFGADWGFNPYAREAVRWHQWVMKSENIEFLRRLPVRQLFTDDAGRTYLLIHGSPRAPLDEYLFPWLPESEFRAVLTYIRQDDLLVGHTHIPMLKVIEGRRIINPGSVGQPRDGDWRASYAIIDTSEEPPENVEFHRVEYDVEEAARKIIEEGLPRFLANRLFEGL
ncbi:metallophosphoesterase, calcineurin superfamily [Thermococcus kodakarensis KOD1]|uniref:Phosphoesterase n=1 Tax=Thermococcus kodakarensis (strain ATCC BAA-918 / JCM 12380 / KOD1) TaxID=69014 RepID=Q5JEY4_THEKO|nr:metallophosphoesterase family protein [Thermococcus kodakarensis]WCN28703.1 metallophosphoesterase family protein [Thermococcus kodakarensis]WCN31001.1 metallophosphoesterase family protein [Thermococcus kodakarensis]BAD84856.1 metallophosphoesterase, calcineurin superfamily [Thermococcus kodakarensis KOD1]